MNHTIKIYIHFFCSVHSPFYTLNTHFSPVPFRSIPRRSCCLNTFARLRRGNFRIYNNAWFMLRATNPPSLQLPRNLPFLLHLNAKFVGWRGVGWVGSNVRPFFCTLKHSVFSALCFFSWPRGVLYGILVIIKINFKRLPRFDYVVAAGESECAWVFLLKIEK